MYGRENQHRKSVRRRITFMGYSSKKFELETQQSGETEEQLARRLKHEYNGIKITPRYAR